MHVGLYALDAMAFRSIATATDILLTRLLVLSMAACLAGVHNVHKHTRTFSLLSFFFLSSLSLSLPLYLPIHPYSLLG